jgi:hypothetical protein
MSIVVKSIKLNFTFNFNYLPTVTNFYGEVKNNELLTGVDLGRSKMYFFVPL